MSAYDRRKHAEAGNCAPTHRASVERSRRMSQRRAQAAKAVAEAIKRGELPPAKKCRCVDCGAPAVCYDHRDYAKPLDVAPVCKRCDCRRGPGKPYPVGGISYKGSLRKRNGRPKKTSAKAQRVA